MTVYEPTTIAFDMDLNEQLHGIDERDLGGLSIAATNKTLTSSTSGLGGGGDNGLGSLADELAAAWDDDEDEDGEEEEEGEGFDAEFASPGEFYQEEVDSTLTSVVSTPQALKVFKAKDRSGGRLRPNGSSSGSEYGDADELEGISLGLERQLNDIKRLASGQSTQTKSMTLGMMLGEGYEDEEEEVEVDNEVIGRLMEGLQKLPSQNAVETGGTRLVAAHASLTSHLTNQTRILRDISFALSQAPPEAADELSSLLPLIPRPNPAPLADLSSLHDLTIDLIAHLSSVSDTLNMARQSSIAANRKLRSAREACAEWKADLKSVEQSRLWIERGNWDEKCRKREAGKACGEVVQGFEMVCRGFEKRMRELEQIESC